MTALERAAREAWIKWGANWALFTLCNVCREIKHCRGPERDRMRCLDCHDQR